MNTYIYLCYEYDPEKEKGGVGFFIDRSELGTIMKIAEDNEMFLLVEEDFDFTKQGEQNGGN